MTNRENRRQAGIPAQSGARFFRCALQVNPGHYARSYRGQPARGGACKHALAIVDRAVELGIEVLAITDHNNVDGVADFQEAAQGRPVHVFPGFELSSSEGVHILCLYPPDSTKNELERYLGEFAIRDTCPNTGLANQGITDVLNTVRGQGGVTIAAHATQDKGLLKALPGKARIQAWRNENLIAIQIPGSISDLKQGHREILENRNPDYFRANAPEERQAVATVNARDVVQPEDLEDPSSTCRIKMQEVTIEGLRQAFLDPGSRIRTNAEFEEAPDRQHVNILSIGWEGGLFDGKTLHLNPDLNVLIGGRGTGKSTIVESVRCALGLDAVDADVQRMHDGIVREVLCNGTRISLRVQVRHPGSQEYLVERTIPNPPLVRNLNGEEMRQAPSDILPGIKVYGQNEISAIARSSNQLASLLRRLAKQDEQLVQRKEAVQRSLRKNRQALCEIHDEIASIEESLSTLPGLEEAHRMFQEAGLEARLRERSLLLREERLIKSIPQRYQQFRESLNVLRQELPIDLTFLSQRALEGLPGGAVIAPAAGVLSKLDAEMTQAAKAMDDALARADAEVDKVRANWEVRRRQVQGEYESILRELQKSKVDGEEFIEIRRKIESLRPLQERLDVLRQLEHEQTKTRVSLLDKREEIQAAEFGALEDAAKAVSEKLPNRVKVKVSRAANRSPLLEFIGRFDGRMKETVDSLKNSPTVTPSKFVADCRAGSEALCSAYGIPPRQADRLVGMGFDKLLQIEEMEFPSATDVELNVALGTAKPSWKSIERLSTGQKATVVLLLLLLDPSAPLIVDQPEDDLDNRFVTEGIVPRMREAKERRQFILSTHNANIPVLGDAELIVGLSAPTGEGVERGIIRSEHVGAIDVPSVRDLVEDVLEGGRRAFEARRRKYGF